MQFKPPQPGQQGQSKPDQQNSQWQQPPSYPPQQGTAYPQWQQPQQSSYSQQIPPQYPQQQQLQPMVQPFPLQQIIVQQPPQPQIETRVETYKKSKDFQKAAKKLAKQGWTVKDTESSQRNRSLAGKLFVPGGLFTKPTEIIVTYQRAIQPQPEKLQIPKGLSFGEQVKWHREQRNKQ